MKRHNKIVRLLCGIAEDIEGIKSSRHASAVVNNGDIVSIGVNKRKSHPFQKKYGRNEDSIFLHAEVSAIHKATKELEDNEFKSCTLYVVRVKYNDQGELEPALAKPCSGCQGCIAEFNIPSVLYTTGKDSWRWLK